MLKNYYYHFKTVTKHRKEVRKLAFKAGMYYQAIMHDLSKYSYTEFYNSAKYYLGHRSPVGNERNDKGYSEIFLHHKGRNKHHLEYWYDPYTENKHISMPDKYILESIIDRIAAAKIYKKQDYTNSTALEYFLNDKPITSIMDEAEYNKFYYLLNYLKDNNEELLLIKIKELYKRGYILDKQKK